MDTNRKWHRKKSDWARSRAADCRREAMAVPGAISPKTQRAAVATVGKILQGERYWIEVAERLEARGE